MLALRQILYLLLFLICISANVPCTLTLPTTGLNHHVTKNEEVNNNIEKYIIIRKRRQFDLTVSADHDDKEDETEIALEAIANLWRSPDGNTQVEGSAKVVHHTNSFQSGPNDWRFGVRIVFQ